MELHYPGYEYLGPGTNLNKRKRPINKLDAAAQKHDFGYSDIQARGYNPYTTWSYADDEFLDDLRKTPWSYEREIAGFLFNAKKYGTKLLGRPTIKRQKTNFGSKPLYSTYNKQFEMPKRYGYSGLRRFRKRRRKMTLYKRIMKILNPSRKAQYTYFMRYIGTLNKTNYAALTNVSDLGQHVSCINSSELMLDAIGRALGITRTAAANWQNTETYLISQKVSFLISNNSNVAMKAKFYMVTHKVSALDDLGTRLNDIDLLNNAEYFSNIAITADDYTNVNRNWCTNLGYNVLDDKFVKNFFKSTMTWKPIGSMIFRPGQTKGISLKQKYRTYTFADFFRDDATRKEMKGKRYIIMVYDGDILPGTLTLTAGPPVARPYTAYKSGVNQGDWSTKINIEYCVMKKPENTSNSYQFMSNRAPLVETVATNLTVLGQSNNAPTNAI